MKRVSFKVAKYLKEAGYPQGQEEYAYRSNGKIYIFESMFDHIPDYCCDAPTYMDVWLWLWNKGICIEIKNNHYYTLVKVNNQRFHGDNPEEAIIVALEYIVDNKLIKQ